MAHEAQTGSALVGVLSGAPIAHRTSRKLTAAPRSKRCGACHQIAPLDAFNRQVKSSDGRQSRCRECRQAAYAEDPDKFRAQGLKWVRQNVERIKEKRRERNKRVQPPLERQRVRWTVANHIRRGTLIRQPCEVCGATPAVGHHNDYTKPLEVRWLCRPCHCRLHRKHTGATS